MSHPAKRLLAELAQLPAEKTTVLYDLFDSGVIKQEDILGHTATSNDPLNGRCLYFRMTPSILHHLNSKAIDHELLRDFAGYTWIAL